MDAFEKFYNKALRFLSFRPRSEKEVRDNLKKKKASDSIIQLVIKKLKEQKFLNDYEFTKWWISERSIIKLRPVRILRIELLQKGISKEMIDEVLENLKDTISDLEKAKRVAEKKIQKYKGLPEIKVKEKLYRFLASKGFDYDTIKEALNNILLNRD